jgi:hypothetical protein
MKNLRHNFVKDAMWIDVHMSKVNYRDSDRELFTGFVRSIRIGEKE